MAKGPLRSTLIEPPRSGEYLEQFDRRNRHGLRRMERIRADGKGGGGPVRSSRDGVLCPADSGVRCDNNRHRAYHASATTDSQGDYSMTLNAGTWTITPTMDDLTFTPRSRSVDLKSDTSDVDFETVVLKLTSVTPGTSELSADVHVTLQDPGRTSRAVTRARPTTSAIPTLPRRRK